MKLERIDIQGEIQSIDDYMKLYDSQCYKEKQLTQQYDNRKHQIKQLEDEYVDLMTQYVMLHWLYNYY